MKFTIETKAFKDAVAAAAKTINVNAIQEMLKNVLITTHETGIRIRATNLETTIELSVTADVEEAGCIAVEGKKLDEWLTFVRTPNVSVSTSGDAANLRAGKRSEFALRTMDGNAFPGLPNESEAETIRISGKVLRAAVAATSFAASKEDSRGQTLTGILVNSGENGTTLVCTDGYRLAKHRDDRPQEANVKFIVPNKALVDASRNLGEADHVEATLLGANKNQLRLTAGETTIYIRLIDGEYPNYEAVLPEDLDKTVVIDTDEFLDALKRTSIVSSDRASLIVVSISEGALGIEANSEGSDHAEEVVDAQVVGEPMKIGLNARYLVEILDHMGSAKTKISLKTARTAAIIEPVAEQGNAEKTYVLMPLMM